MQQENRSRETTYAVEVRTPENPQPVPLTIWATWNCAWNGWHEVKKFETVAEVRAACEEAPCTTLCVVMRAMSAFGKMEDYAIAFAISPNTTYSFDLCQYVDASDEADWRDGVSRLNFRIEDQYFDTGGLEDLVWDELKKLGAFKMSPA